MSKKLFCIILMSCLLLSCKGGAKTASPSPTPQPTPKPQYVLQLENSIANTNSTVSKLSGEVKTQANNEKTLNTKVDAIQSTIVSLQNKVDNLPKIASNQPALENRIGTIETKLSSLSISISNLETSVSNLASLKPLATTVVKDEELAAKVNALVTDITSTKKSIADLSKDVADLKTGTTNTWSRLDKLAADMANFTTQINRLVIKIGEIGTTPISSSEYRYLQNDDGTASTTSGAGYRFGQTFSLTANKTVMGFEGKFVRNGSPGLVTFYLTKTINGVPTGGILSAGNLDGNQVKTQSEGEWYFVDMTDCAIEAGIVYALYANCTVGESSNWFGWRMDASAPLYSYGTGVLSSNYGSSWTKREDFDMMFRLVFSEGGEG